MLYQPEVTDGEIHIITGKDSPEDKHWNGELLLTPFWEMNIDSNERFCQWSTVDTAFCDYAEDQKFMVFSKTEVMQMIHALTWALSGCEGAFNQDIWICGDTVLTDNDMYEDGGAS